jgi:hypothetical protein
VGALGAVRCTPYRICQAKKHAIKTSPKIPVAKSVNGHYGIDPQRKVVVASFLRDQSADQVAKASLASSTKGARFRLKARRFRLW